MPVYLCTFCPSCRALIVLNEIPENKSSDPEPSTVPDEVQCSQCQECFQPMVFHPKEFDFSMDGS
jgi:hypothetical protein